MRIRCLLLPACLLLGTACMSSKDGASARPTAYPPNGAFAARNPPARAAWAFPSLPNVPPIDLSRIAPAAGSGPCAPVMVAPSVWIAPDCSNAMTHALAASPFLPRRAQSLGLNQGSLPSDVDLRAQGLDGPVKDQQMVGICWAFATSTLMDNAIRRSGRQDVIAPLHVLSSKIWDQIWQKGRSDRDLTLEPAWAYDPVKGCKLNEDRGEIWCEQAYHVQRGSWRSDPELVAEVERANITGAYRITKVETLSVKPVDVDQLMRILSSGQAIYVSFDYNKQAWGDTGNSGAVIPDYVQGDGGHAVAIVGYRSAATGHQFLLHNSWGKRWRDGGYAWISEAMVRSHLMDAFTLEVAPRGLPVGSDKSNPLPSALPFPLPFPLPSTLPETGASNPAPASGACGEGQVRDWLRGVCVAACGNGLPPVAGVCIQ